MNKIEKDKWGPSCWNIFDEIMIVRMAKDKKISIEEATKIYNEKKLEFIQYKYLILLPHY